MKKLYIIFIFIIFSINLSYSQTGWFQQNNITPTANAGLLFLNSNTGWVITTGNIQKTTNGGLNWFTQHSMINSYKIVSMSSDKSNNIWSLCIDSLNNLNFRVVKSSNFGNNWNIIFTGISNYRTLKIYVVSDSIAWIIGLSKLCLKTTNSGYSWVQKISQGASELSEISFVNDNTGWLSTSYWSFPGNWYDANVYKTTDGGENWINQVHYTSAGIYNVYFINPSTGFFSSSGSVNRTTNGGINWYSLNFRSGTYCKLYFPTQDTGYLVGVSDWYSNIDIYKSTNSGATWGYQIYPITNERVTSIFFVNSKTGWATKAGMLLHTTDGGGTIISSINSFLSEIPDNFSLEQNYPNPFNSMTKIQFQVPSLKFVKLVVFDLLGRELKTLVNESLQPGTYSVLWNASNQASGIYFYTLSAPGYRETRRMIFIK